MVQLLGLRRGEIQRNPKQDRSSSARRKIEEGIDDWTDSYDDDDNDDADNDDYSIDSNSDDDDDDDGDSVDYHDKI